jgi:hypothetical protein
VPRETPDILTRGFHKEERLKGRKLYFRAVSQIGNLTDSPHPLIELEKMGVVG